MVILSPSHRLKHVLYIRKLISFSVSGRANVVGLTSEMSKKDSFGLEFPDVSDRNIIVSVSGRANVVGLTSEMSKKDSFRVEVEVSDRNIILIFLPYHYTMIW